MNSSLVTLTRATRRRIQRLDRKTRDANLRIRCRVILKVAEGLSRHAAARQLGCAPSTAWWIVERFCQWGEASLLDGRRENGSCKVDEDVREGIRQILIQRPSDFGYARPSWTLELLALVVDAKLKVNLSVGHLCRVLHAMRIRWGRPRPIVGCPWKTRRRKARLRELRRLAESPPAGDVVLYADEVDIHLNPRLGPDWMLPGTQRCILTPGRNEKRYLAGAYDPKRERMIYVEGNRKASWLFIRLLRTLLRAYRTARTIHLILDNYIIHKSKIVTRVLSVAGGAKPRIVGEERRICLPIG